MRGKEKCRILREIRRRIADENEIPFVTEECGFKGECRGTCPRCESELRYLERQLAARSALGKRVAVAALCAGLGFAASGCAPSDLLPLRPARGTDLSGAVAYSEPTEPPEEDPELLMGKMTGPETDRETQCKEPQEPDGPEIETTTGEVAWPEESPEPRPVELTGDVAWTPESEANG